MSFLRAGANQQAQIPEYTGLQIQTSSGAIPVPIVYGESPIAPNFIWAQNFQAQATHGGGKGSFLEGPVTGYNYTASIILGLCEGPATFGAIWNGNDTTDLAGLGSGFVEGDNTQEPLGFI
jgi:hypothetical protein